MAVFENEHVLIINKDNGIPSQMGSGLDPQSTISLDKMLSFYLKQEDSLEDGYLVHRLD